MSQLVIYSAAVQEIIVAIAYDCLERIRKSAETTKLTVKPMKELVYQLACHSLIEEILIEFFLPGEVMKDKDYMDVEWKDAFKVIDMAAPPTGHNYEVLINKTLRKEMYDLMRENGEVEEAEKAEEEGKKLGSVEEEDEEDLKDFVVVTNEEEEEFEWIEETDCC